MIYVDKTEYIWRIIENNKYVFLSRPRRFGKSLIISTLESYFRGEQELFTGLAIDRLATDWTPFPVLRFDFSQVDYLQPGQLQSTLPRMLMGAASNFGLELSEQDPAAILGELLQAVFHKHSRVVVLIDEYDKPLVNILHRMEVFRENRRILNQFYAVLKSFDAQLRFVMLTGISRFSKVGVFSGLNNLKDISLKVDFAGITGFSQQELEANFPDHLSRLEATFEMDREALLGELRHYYNGYSWDGESRYYNPFSILNVLEDAEMENYWYKTATPTLLYHTLVRENLAPTDLVNIRTLDLTGFVAEDGSVPTYPLLFQTGYLTIDRITRYNRRRVFHLRYPNEEVEQSFLILATAAFKGTNSRVMDRLRNDLQNALLDGELETFFRHLRGYFSEIPARLHVEREAYYHSMMFALFRMLGMNTDLERETHRGRIDAVLEVPDRIYIFEFKWKPRGEARPETLSRKAIEQIKRNNYAAAYLATGKPVVLVGLGFVDRELHGRYEEVTRR